MKQVFNRTKAFLLALLILATSTGLCQSIVALEEDTPITVTTATEFTNALNSVPDGGTIVISGTCTLAPTFRWTKHNKSITIKGENLVDVDFSVIDNYYVDYEYNLNSIDVTGCPKLETLNVKRTNSWGDSALKYVYMTAAQAATVAVTKVDKVEIVVR